VISRKVSYLPRIGSRHTALFASRVINLPFEFGYCPNFAAFGGYLDGRDKRGSVAELSRSEKDAREEAPPKLSDCSASPEIIWNDRAIIIRREF
jgi:hypothetical protein